MAKKKKVTDEMAELLDEKIVEMLRSDLELDADTIRAITARLVAKSKVKGDDPIIEQEENIRNVVKPKPGTKLRLSI